MSKHSPQFEQKRILLFPEQLRQNFFFSYFSRFSRKNCYFAGFPGALNTLLELIPKTISPIEGNTRYKLQHSNSDTKNITKNYNLLTVTGKGN